MKTFRYKIPIIAYSVLIFIISSLSLNEVPSLKIGLLDKLVHFGEYTIYGLLLMLAFATAKSNKIVRYSISLSLCVGILFGLLDEIHQYFVPGRTCSVLDLLADVIGVWFGTFLFSKIVKHREIHVNEVK